MVNLLKSPKSTIQAQNKGFTYLLIKAYDIQQLIRRS